MFHSSNIREVPGNNQSQQLTLLSEVISFFSRVTERLASEIAHVESFIYKVSLMEVRNTGSEYNYKFNKDYGFKV